MGELLHADYRFRLKNALPLLYQIPSIVRTHIEGKITTHSWPLSATFLLPMMEEAAGVRTPISLLPVVASFYNYLRFTDDFFDELSYFPDWEETMTATQPFYDTLLRHLADVVDKREILYMSGRISELQQRAYQALQKQNSWSASPSYVDAYSYRLNTTGALSDVVAELWCHAVNVAGKREDGVRTLVQRVGMLFQFRDDCLDLKDDTDTTGNLVRAILNEESQKDIALNACESEAKTPLLATMMTYTPESLERLMRSMEYENSEIRKVSLQAADFLDGFMKISLPRITI